MNGLQNRRDWSYQPRWLAGALVSRVAAFPITVLTGPRQVGKSTLVRHDPGLTGFEHLDLDDIELRGRVQRDPALPWRGRDRVVVDEVHRVPDLLPALKAEVDRRPEMRVVLTGSADLLPMRHVSESLAGRAAYLALHAFCEGEWAGRAPPDVVDRALAGEAPRGTVEGGVDPAAAVVRGLLPPARLHRDPVAWWEAYVRTYLERDLRDLSSVASLPDFRRFMELLALRTGQVHNETALAAEVGMSQPTIHRWVNLLEVSNVAVRVPAYSANRGKRVTRRPRIYLMDPGLAAFLGGLYAPSDVAAARELGALFECLVLSHLRVLASLMTPAARLFHWRTSDGKEVDFVVAHGRRLLPVECKHTAHPSARHVKNIRLFMNLHDGAATGMLVHTGGRIEDLGGGIWAVPWTLLAGLGNRAGPPDQTS